MSRSGHWCERAVRVDRAPPRTTPLGVRGAHPLRGDRPRASPSAPAASVEPGYAGRRRYEVLGRAIATLPGGLGRGVATWESARDVAVLEWADAHPLVGVSREGRPRLRGPSPRRHHGRPAQPRTGTARARRRRRHRRRARRGLRPRSPGGHGRARLLLDAVSDDLRIPGPRARVPSALGVDARLSPEPPRSWAGTAPDA